MQRYWFCNIQFKPFKLKLNDEYFSNKNQQKKNYFFVVEKKISCIIFFFFLILPTMQPNHDREFEKKKTTTKIILDGDGGDVDDTSKKKFPELLSNFLFWHLNVIFIQIMSFRMNIGFYEYIFFFCYICVGIVDIHFCLVAFNIRTSKKAHTHTTEREPGLLFDS